jgi:threonine/homoserine/homoserine lactone efflux protein
MTDKMIEWVLWGAWVAAPFTLVVCWFAFVCYNLRKIDVKTRTYRRPSIQPIVISAVLTVLLVLYAYMLRPR